MHGLYRDEHEAYFTSLQRRLKIITTELLRRKLNLEAVGHEQGIHTITFMRDAIEYKHVAPKLQAKLDCIKRYSQT